MMVSANDAAYSIANTVGHGSLDAFAADLNSTAKRLGMRDSTFGDPAGLDDGTSYKGGPFTSAYDLAIAARNALTVPAIAKWAALHEYQFVDNGGTHHDLTNHNRMLPGVRLRVSRSDRIQDGLHEPGAALARRGRDAQRPHVDRGDPRWSRRGVHHRGGPARRRIRAAELREGRARSCRPSPCRSTGARAEDRASFAALGKRARRATTRRPAPRPSRFRHRFRSGAIAPRARRSDRGDHCRSASRQRAVLVAQLRHRPALARRRRVRAAAASSQASTRRAGSRNGGCALAKMRSGGLTVVDGRYRAGIARRATGRVRHERSARLDTLRRYQGIATPPFGRSIWPVMNAAASDTR